MEVNSPTATISATKDVVIIISISVRYGDDIRTASLDFYNAMIIWRESAGRRLQQVLAVVVDRGRNRFRLRVARVSNLLDVLCSTGVTAHLYMYTTPKSAGFVGERDGHGGWKNKIMKNNNGTSMVVRIS